MPQREASRQAAGAAKTYRRSDGSPLAIENHTTSYYPFPLLREGVRGLGSDSVPPSLLGKKLGVRF